MIVFDLRCEEEHAFEGWFEDIEDLENQLQQKLVNCPICSSSIIRSMPSTFTIAKRRPESTQETAIRSVKQALYHYFCNNFEDVGHNFAREALKMHYGVRELSNIRGVSTPQEEEILQKENIHFFKIINPFLKPTLKDEEN